jgi:hypothetical protein
VLRWPLQCKPGKSVIRHLPYTIWKRELFQHDGRSPHESKGPRVVLTGSSNIAYEQPKKHLPLLADRHEAPLHLDCRSENIFHLESVVSAWKRNGHAIYSYSFLLMLREVITDNLVNYKKYST